MSITPFSSVLLCFWEAHCRAGTFQNINLPKQVWLINQSICLRKQESYKPSLCQFSVSGVSGKQHFQKVPNLVLNYSLCSLFNGKVTFQNLDPFKMENVQYYLREGWRWFTMHDFFSLYTLGMVIFLLRTYIYIFCWTFLDCFFYRVYKSNQTGILQSSDIIFCAYSTMYWIMLAHVLLLLFSPDWERMTVGAVNSLGFQHHRLNQEPCSGWRRDRASVHYTNQFGQKYSTVGTQPLLT